MHPLHAALHNELHARPSLYFDGPAVLHHFAFLQEGMARHTLIDALATATGVDMDLEAAQQIIEHQGLLIKWEQHTEFFTVTVKSSASPEVLWPDPPALLAELLDRYADCVVCASLLRVEASHQWAGQVEAYGFHHPTGSRVGNQDATVWSDFQLDDHRTNRLLLVNSGLDRFRLGRMTRRLFDIETYRMMAMLGLPVARALSEELTGYETRLTELSARHAEDQRADPEPLLKELTALSAHLERCGAQTRRRFSATDAYSQLVIARIEELREERVGESPRLGTFILRRFQPAVRYCEAINQRQTSLLDSATRLNDLLRTRAQVDIEAQNSTILASLDARTKSQLKIQKAVESLSIIVISYYLFSLFKLGLQSLDALGVKVEATTAALVLAPVALLILGFLSVRIAKVKEH